MKSKRPAAKKLSNKFVRATVTLPAGLEPFARQRAAHPTHAGNLSSYVRNLILDDQLEFQKQSA